MLIIQNKRDVSDFYETLLDIFLKEIMDIYFVTENTLIKIEE